MLILMIELLKDLSYGVSCEHWVGFTCLDYVPKSLGVGALVWKSVSVLLVPLVKLLKLLIVEESLPVIWPALSQWIPCSWARLTVTIFLSSDVILTIPWHVYLKLSKDLLIWNTKVRQESLSECVLEIEAILPSLNFVTAINEFRATCNTDIDPLILVSPCVQVTKDLRLSATSLTPEKTSGIESLKGSFAKSNSSNVFWAPVMIALFVISLHIHLVVHRVALLMIKKAFR